MLAEMVVGIGVNAAKLASGLKAAEGNIAGFGQKAQKVGGGIAKVGAASAAAVTLPLAGLAKIGISELGEIETANNRTAAALGRIGSKSLVSVAGVQALASALQKKSGIDDAVIQNGANMLLTLGNIDTKTKQGAATFKTATTAAVNFAEATGTEAQAASKLFAKSIAAASQGTLLLPKGVKLSATETAKLTAVLKSGASAGTKQAAVAEALGKKFAGAANLTSADKWANMQDQFAGIAAELVSTLMPAVEKLTGWLQGVMDKWEQLSPAQQKWVAIALAVAAAIPPIVTGLGLMVMGIGALIPVFGAMGTAAAAAWVAVTGPIGLAVIAIAAVIAVGILVWKKWDEIKAGLVAVWEGIKGAASSAWEWIKGFIEKHAVAVATAVTGPIGGLAVWLYKNWDTVKSQASAAWTALKGALTGAASAVAGGIRSAIGAVTGFLTSTWTSVQTGITTSWATIKTTAVTAATGLLNGITGVVDDVVGKISAIWTSVKTGIVTAWATITTTAKTEAGQLLSGIVGVINDLPGKFAEIGKDAGGKLAGAIKSAINGIISKWNGLSFGGFKVGKGKASFTVPKVSTPDIPLLAKGGIAYGPTLAGIGEYRGARSNPEVVAPLDRLLGIMGRAGGGGGLQVVITGNHIAGDYDVDRLGDRLVARLRLAGVATG